MSSIECECKHTKEECLEIYVEYLRLKVSQLERVIFEYKEEFGELEEINSSSEESCESCESCDSSDSEVEWL